MMQKPKFEVGDRVEDKYRGEGTIIDIIKQFMLYLVEYDRKIVGGHNGNGICDVKGKEGHCYYENAIDLKRVEEKDMKETIVIYRNGKETIALFKRDNKVIRKANARCHPDDTYDFKAGADIVYKRLMGDSKPDASNHVYTDDEWQDIEKAYQNRCDEIVDIKAELRCINDNCNYWKSKYTNLKDKLSKQKEINKELVDENEKLKAEAGKLKSSNREIEIYDTVKIVNRGGCYSCREGFIRQYVPSVLSKFRMGDTPKNGDIGLIVAKAKPKDEKEMIYAILIDGQVYVMNERGIKLHNN